ncbi:transcriptional regulator [Paenibacillus gansuensis]|uniref:Transcriptional regulator n=1 Tax=Paenibacillus gansuensis TaxID=306542 RepID=A0ABW5PBT6_9BACL
MWMKKQLDEETNPRRLELLHKGLGHGTLEFLRLVWFPAVQNFEHLYAEWEVRDYSNGFRYLDLAYMPGGVEAAIEIQGYVPHARDIDLRRFKDLCWRHCFLALDGWTLMPVAYLSIMDEPKRCQQLVLALIGKFIAADVPPALTCLEAETVRFARRMLRPFSPTELAGHTGVSERHARRILHALVEKELLAVSSGKQRYRLFVLRT